MATYTQEQIALCFAYLAYTDELLTSGTPTLDAQIAQDLTAAMSASAATPIPPIAGNWSLAWGPVSFTFPGAKYQDNMMYVVQLDGSTPPQYFVAVRGTNGASTLDWLLEDFFVLETVAWPLDARGSDVVGQISVSASIGIGVLNAMRDPAIGKTLQEFLAEQMANVSAGPVPICFTGHSLGAALASTLALSMLESQSSWDPNGYGVVSAITFAGPTAGDADFAAYSDQTFAASAGSVQRVTTSQDIIPLFWNAATMKKVAGLYTGHGVHDIFSIWVDGLMAVLADLVAPVGYTQIEAGQAATPAPFIYASNLPPGSKDAFLAEAGYQHHFSYPCVLGVPSLLQAIVNANEFSSTSTCASN